MDTDELLTTIGDWRRKIAPAHLAGLDHAHIVVGLAEMAAILDAAAEHALSADLRAERDTARAAAMALEEENALLLARLNGA